ncbi:ABC transporter permease/substrate-binding protein [Eisenibacter elegans]|jgi:osmoprotectant transport system permease protein|uniref:ABC transporter permease/substrate-binding protein n=1 Tax=Eisenibacter elegans TaxID=997 RepID=UPI00040AF6C7|nr:ABC transporter permease/substrate-binding protein [Eisenibacter elegans]
MQDFLLFFYTQRNEILRQTLQHLYLTGASLVLAIALGLIIGIWLSRRPKAAAFVLGVLGVIQTVPSLALLGFMLPLLGIGAIPAITALFLYSLLPIARNAYTGLREVDPHIREAALAIGMTQRQLLWKVTLPLALPTIFAGLRTATVINVGVATLCALVAAGGLGEFIFRGVALNNSYMVLSGAIPAALLAIGLDTLLAWAERRVRRPLPWRAWGIGACLGLGLCFIYWAISALGNQTSNNGQRFRMGFDAEFVARADGYPGLQMRYQMPQALRTVELDAGLMYQALKTGEVDVIGGYSTDGRIEAYQLQVLEDDLRYFPPYAAVPLLQADFTQRFPEIVALLDTLRISVEEMRRLNYAVDGQKQSPQAAAKAFLEAKGWLRGQPIPPNLQADKLRIGGKKFTEQYILGQIIAQLVAHHTPYQPVLKTGLGGTQIAFEALKNDQIDLYPEYTGTALLVLLKTPEATYQSFIQQPDSVASYIRKTLARKHQIKTLSSLGFENTYALMIRQNDAKTYHIATISDLVRYLKQSNNRSFKH